jgi:HK97 family phage prohead protease
MNILKVRDYASLVPTDFGHVLREAILSSCVTPAYMATRGIDQEKRTATFVFTDPSLDSYNEIIDAGAFDASLPQFMRNPVVLPEHQHRLQGSSDAPIVGHITSIFKRGSALLGSIFFGDWPVGDCRWRAVVAGSLRAVSVGFRPVKTVTDKDGVVHYTDALLREVSTVAVGANENALLVNMYVAGQLEVASMKTPDRGLSAELTGAVESLRSQLNTMLAQNRDGDKSNTDGMGSDEDAFWKSQSSHDSGTAHRETARRSTDSEAINRTNGKLELLLARMRAGKSA